MKIGKDYIGVGCGALIVNDKNEVLLLRRNKNARNNAGFWSQPGGTVEFGEKVEDAIKREIQEEFNVTVDLFHFCGYVDHIIPSENQHWVSMAYLARITDGTPKNMEPDKHDDMQWFSLDTLPSYITDPTLLTLKKYREYLATNPEPL